MATPSCAGGASAPWPAPDGCDATERGTRLAGTALVVGGALSIAGLATATTVFGSADDTRFASPLWTPINAVAVAGAIITVLGLPAILAAHRDRAPRLTLLGYVGVVLTIVMLNIGESVIETFVKPYLVTHGGIPADAPAGFDIYIDIALFALIVGLISLGIAVFRARVFPRWVGVAFLASAPLSVVQVLPGPLALLGDYLAFAALIAIGWTVARTSPTATLAARSLASDRTSV